MRTESLVVDTSSDLCVKSPQSSCMICCGYTTLGVGMLPGNSTLMPNALQCLQYKYTVNYHVCHSELKRLMFVSVPSCPFLVLV